MVWESLITVGTEWTSYWNRKYDINNALGCIVILPFLKVEIYPLEFSKYYSLCPRTFIGTFDETAHPAFLFQTVKAVSWNKCFR